MRKIIANIFITLDGVMQSPSGPEEDPIGNFKYGGWITSYWDEMMGKTLDEFLANPLEILLGRRTYEIFAAHWPYIQNDPGRINSMRQKNLWFPKHSINLIGIILF
jgi:dihydrofolate reductase